MEENVKNQPAWRTVTFEAFKLRVDHDTRNTVTDLCNAHC
jgi:hypothetical protein